jgi:hypothetical protein
MAFILLTAPSLVEEGAKAMAELAIMAITATAKDFMVEADN